MIAPIEDICVEKKHWITHDDMMSMTVIAESTPGPIAINCATFVGYRKKGIAGAAAATLGVVLPSFVILYLISIFLVNVLEITWIASAFKGIKIAVSILILDAAVRMIQKMEKNPVSLGIMLCAYLVMLLINIFSWKISSAVLMLAAACVNLVIAALRKMSAKKGGER